MLQEEENENHYKKLKTGIEKIMRSYFLKMNFGSLYKYALNYCIKKINSGKSRYYHEILDLYKVLLEQKVIFPQWFHHAVDLQKHHHRRHPLGRI